MKRSISLLLCALLAAALAIPALADVIWEPNDDFYFEHYSECELVEADYEATRDAPIQKSPRDKTASGTIPAGETVRVSWRWNGGWGYVETSDGSGWVDLSRFRRCYNGADFRAENADAIRDAAGSIPRAENPVILVRAYPGAADISDRIDAEGFAWAEDDPAYAESWTDADGREWVYIPYYYGCRGWVCRTDPGTETPAGGMPEYAVDTPDADRTAPLVVTLIAVALAVTALLLYVFLRKKGRK